MDQALLVDLVDEGRLLITELLRDGLDVTVAFWVRRDEDASWRLYISTETEDGKGDGKPYHRVYTCLERTDPWWMTIGEIHLFHPSDPISLAAVRARDRVAGRMPTRLPDRRLASLTVEEAYFYPRMHWFEGFDTIKKNHPSAEIFTLPVLSPDALAEPLRKLSGQVNASIFEGRAASTVLFMGLRETNGKAPRQLVFLYRPEGWNNLYRADTSTWEEVVHGRTGKKLYEEADFGQFMAMRTEEKLTVRRNETIRPAMEEGVLPHSPA